VEITDRQKSDFERTLPAASADGKSDLPVLYLDFAPPGLPSVRLVGRKPDFLVEGSLADVRSLEDALAEGRGRGLPGGLGGVISYEGNFTFGFYSQWEDLFWPDAATPLEPYQLSLAPSVPRDRFMAQVEAIKEWIAAGDIYQTCLTYQMKGTFAGSAAALFRDWVRHSPAPMAGFWDHGTGQILSDSPELFLDFQDRIVRTRPIKGTRPRGGFGAMDLSEDSVAEELLSSGKERAELTMITDLERNDLGQFCQFGTVEVEDFLRLEKYAQVFHLVSTVRGRLPAGVSQPAALAASFPGGSITGAPKKRSREIIAGLEHGPRGFYTGAMGFFGFDGNSRFNLMIRTLVLQDGKASYGTGAGIVADSDPATEWLETLAKARGIVDLCEQSKR